MGQSQRLQDPHRKSYMEMVKTLEESGDYVVNNSSRAAKTNKKNLRAAQSYLWSQIPLVSTTTQYVFNVQDGLFNVGNPGILPEEKRIKLQDVFFTYALGFFLICKRTAGGNTTFAYQLATFPNPYLYGAGALDLNTMVGIWTQGVLNVQVNGDTLTPAWDMSQHYYIPQTQVPAFPISGSEFFSQQDLSDDGYVVTEPNWIINGANNNLYTVNYNNNWGGVNLGGGNTWHIAMKWQGFLAQNASSIMDNATKKG